MHFFDVGGAYFFLKIALISENGYLYNVSAGGRCVKTRITTAMEDLTVLGSCCWLVTPSHDLCTDASESLPSFLHVQRAEKSFWSPITDRPASLPAACCFPGPKRNPDRPHQVVKHLLSFSLQSFPFFQFQPPPLFQTVCFK